MTGPVLALVGAVATVTTGVLADVVPEKSSGPSWGYFLVALIALAVIVGAVVLLLARRRRRQA